MNQLEKQYKSLPLQARIDMALAENIPSEYRKYIACDQWNVIRCYFSRRADLSKNEVEILIKDDDYVIRLSIAKRNDLTNEQVQHCVDDADPNVRHAIARNVLLTEKQREKLVDDIDELVQKAARKGPRKMQFRQRHGQARLVR